MFIPFKWFAVGTLTAGISSGATSFSVAAGEGARFNDGTQGDFLVVWNASDYANPADAFWAGHADVVQQTNRSTDTFTVSRGYLTGKVTGYSGARNLNVSGKTYRVAQCITPEHFANYHVSEIV